MEWWVWEQSLRDWTYLVVDLGRGVLEINRLLEDVALLLELDALGPVVEGAGDVDLFGGVFPVRQSRVSWA